MNAVTVVVDMVVVVLVDDLDTPRLPRVRGPRKLLIGFATSRVDAVAQAAIVKYFYFVSKVGPYEKRSTRRSGGARLIEHK